MSDRLITHDELRGVVRLLIRMFVTAHVEALALGAVLLNRGDLLPQELEAMRARLLQETEPSLRAFDEADDDKILEMLQRFEGPIQ